MMFHMKIFLRMAKPLRGGVFVAPEAGFGAMFMLLEVRLFAPGAGLRAFEQQQAGQNASRLSCASASRMILPRPLW